MSAFSIFVWYENYILVCRFDWLLYTYSYQYLNNNMFYITYLIYWKDCVRCVVSIYLKRKHFFAIKFPINSTPTIFKILSRREKKKGKEFAHFTMLVTVVHYPHYSIPRTPTSRILSRVPSSIRWYISLYSLWYFYFQLHF